MADKDAKPSKDINHWVLIEEIILIMILAAVAYRILFGLPTFFSNFAMHTFGQDSVIRRFFADPSLYNLRRIIGQSFWLSLLSWAFSLLKWLAYLISGLLILWIIWLFKKLSALNASDEEAAKHIHSLGHVEEETVDQKRWKHIVTLSRSENPSDWRLAILEADIILDDILDINGYRGETMADKLKQVEPSDMNSINEAWEAHRIRNAIAHEGQGFTLTAREAQRVIGLYEKVFREYEFI